MKTLKSPAVLSVLMFLFLTGCGQQEPSDQVTPSKQTTQQVEDSTQKQVGVEVEKASDAVEVSVAQSEETGSVSGQILFGGEYLPPARLDTSADPQCKALSPNLLSEELLVSDNQGLKNVFIYAKGSFQGLTSGTSLPPVTLDQKGCRYEPHVLGIQTGQTLTVLNSDATLHNVHGMPKKSKEFNLGMPVKGMKLKRVFNTSEQMVKFKCDVHPWMSAYIGVMEHPFFAVTDDSGNFSIEGLPVGNHQLVLWHEKLGERSIEVIVEADKTASASYTFER